MSLAELRTERLVLRPLAASDLDDYGLVCLIAPGNDASVRVVEKLGMAFEREVPFHDRPTMLYVLEA